MAHLFSPQGRSPRSVYFLHSILDGVVGLLLIAALGMLIPFLGPGVEPLVAIGTLGVLGLMGWSEVAITVRRLHDLDRPGSHFVLLMIPLYNIYLQLVLMFVSGTVGVNRFGPDPLASTGETATSGESLIQQGTRHEINGDWDLAFDCYKEAAAAFAGQPDEEYAINCIKRLQEKMRLASSTSVQQA